MTHDDVGKRASVKGEPPGRGTAPRSRGGDVMVPLLLVLLLILVLFGAGFAAEVLWYIAIAVLVLWVLGFFMRAGSARWYRW